MLRIKLNNALLGLKRKVMAKKNGDKAVMIELGFAIVGVVLLVVFREQITTVIKTIGAFLQSKIQALFV
ncbi:MAG: hypothetical protein ACLR3R_18610 [Clostridium paraputrificum]